MGLGGVACPKPPSRKLLKGRKVRAQRKVTKDVRSYVFARERDRCRICRMRSAESMHELKPRSLGGKVSRHNSVAVCGSGTTGCHGLAQAHEIEWCEWTLSGSAEETLHFHAKTRNAAEWLRLKVGQIIESPTMVEMETAE